MNARFLQTIVSAALLSFPLAAVAQDSPGDMPRPEEGRDEAGRDEGVVPTGQDKTRTDKTGMDKTQKTGMDKMDHAGKHEVGQKLGNMEVVPGVDDLQYRAAPDFLPSGAELALIEGDPASGVFTGYLRVPSGWRMPASRNAGELHVLVVQGSVRVGRESVDSAARLESDFGDDGGLVRTGSPAGGTGATGTTPAGGTTGAGTTGAGGSTGMKTDEMGRTGAMGNELVVNEGGFVRIPRNEVFTLTATENAVLHVHGMGAWNPTFLNATEDPRSGKTPASTPAIR